MTRRVLASVGYAAGLPVLLVVAWALATRGTTNLYYPPPSRVLDAFVSTWLAPATLVEDVLPSLGRFAVGVLLSIVIGVVAGTAIGATPWLRALL